MVNKKLNWKEKILEFFRPNIKKILITLIFILIASLSLFGIKPFAYYTTVGDVVVAKPSILVTGPLVPLLFIMDVTNTNIDLGKQSGIPSLILFLVVILIYYYLISCLLVFIYKKLKRKNEN